MKLEPMTPGLVIPRLDHYSGPLPEGWHWQVKLNDERCLLTATEALNKKGVPLSPRKVKAYAEAFKEVRAVYVKELSAGLPFVDLALLGYRAGPWETGYVVVLDVPLPGLTWQERYEQHVADCWPSYLPELGEKVLDIGSSLNVYFQDPRPLFRTTVGRIGLEGVVGRDPSGLYIHGKSNLMAKSRF